MIGAARYFAPRYWAPRYWAKVGLDAPVDTEPDVIANAIYQRYSDNVAPNATITVDDGTPDTEYPPAFMVDGNPAKPAKITDTDGAFLFDFLTAQRLDLFALIHTTIDGLDPDVIGATVTLQGNATDSWGSPSFEVSIPIPLWLGTGARRWPVNAWLDLTTATGYSETGFRYWRLVIAGNSQNIEIGEIWMSPTIRRLDPDIRWGATRTTRKLDVEHVTSYGVTAGMISRGTTIWRQDGEILLTDDLRTDLIAQWYDVDGRVLPWLLIPDGDQNAAYLVRWATSEQQIARLFNDAHNMQVSVVEVGRGLRPGV